MKRTTIGWRGAGLFALAGVLLIGGAAARAGHAAPPEAARYAFEEGSGKTAADADGGAAAALMGAAGWTPGVVGAHALSLSGAPGAFVDIPRPLVDTSRSYTVMAWVRLHRLGGYQTFVSIDGDQVSGFFLQLRDDTSTFAFTTPPTRGTGSGGAVTLADDPPEAGVWYHLTGVYDAAAHTTALYVDGEVAATQHLDSAWEANGHTVIGRGKFNGNPVDWAAADIDDVRLYQAALTPADIHAIALANLPPASAAALKPARLTIDGRAPAGPKLNPLLHGLMTEEISHAYDGGLYGELIQNRTLQDDPNRPVAWSVPAQEPADGPMVLDNAEPLNAALPRSLKLVFPAGGGKVGAANSGFWGIPIRPDTTYKTSLYALGSGGFTGRLELSLESLDGATVYARGTTGPIGESYRRYALTLRTGGKVPPTAAARFVIRARGSGAIDLTLVSLFGPTYHNRPNGARIDLMEKQAGLNPAFLRLPGGNYLEGDTVATRFDWKKTIGPLEGRPGHQGPWGYRSSDGMGLLEMLEWCEDLHMEPLLAVYAGYSLNRYKNPNPERAAPGPALQPFVQDALDEIEYLTGDAHSTRWGAERARDGHPTPFSLHYVEIGNEDWFDQSGSYDGRFAQFFDAIRAKYPHLQLIATAPVRTRVPDIIDEHYYLSAAVFESRVHQYDSYKRTGPKIFVGEWASQSGNPTPDLNAALGDAAWLTGIERNADVVVLESYAPLLVNINPGAAQWGTNLIGYDALHSYGSPSYWAQAMFANNHGDVVVPAKWEGGSRMACSVTRDSASGKIYIKLVNAAHGAQAIGIDLPGFAQIDPVGSEITLHSSRLHDTNTITEPEKVVPVRSKLNGVGAHFTFTAPGYSVTVLTIGAR